MSNKTASSTILVVEDRVNVRLLLADVFDGEGYTVLLSANGQEALRTLEYQELTWTSFSRICECPSWMG